MTAPENTTKWVNVACEIADVIRHSGHVTPWATWTDPDGLYGEPSVYAEWAPVRAEAPILREWRYPQPGGGGPDRKPCVHQVPTRGDQDD